MITRLNVGGPLRQLEALGPGINETPWRGPVLHGTVEPHETDGKARLRDRGVYLIALPGLERGFHPIQDVAALRVGLAMVRRLRPRIIHSHLSKAGALARTIGRIEGIPCVHTFHGHHFAVPGLRGRGIRWIERGVIPQATRYIALSERQRRDILRTLGPSAPVSVVGPGLNLAELDEGSLRDDVTIGWPHPTAMRWLWTGRLVDVKRPRLLLEALCRSAGSHQIVFLGDGPLRDELRASVRAMDLADRVFVVGHVAIDEVPAWIASADAIVLCSKSEGTPISILEAMALGRPVVVPTVGGLPDIVAHDRTGVWVTPGSVGSLAEAMDRLGNNPRLCKSLGTTGRAAVQARFSAHRLVKDTVSLYEQVVAGFVRG